MRKQVFIGVALAVACSAGIAGCKEAGWAKDEEINNMKPPAGQLPPLPSSYFPPPPTSSSTPPPAPPPAPVPTQQPTAVTVTQVVPAPAPEPAPAPAPANQPPVITIPLPGHLF